MVFTASKQAKYSPDVRWLLSLIRVEKEEKRRQEKKRKEKKRKEKKRKEKKRKKENTQKIIKEKRGRNRK